MADDSELAERVAELERKMAALEGVFGPLGTPAPVPRPVPPPKGTNGDPGKLVEYRGLRFVVQPGDDVEAIGDALWKAVHRDD